MSFYVSDPEAERLAETIAEATGETVAIAVTIALRERLDRLHAKPAKASVDELLEIAGRISSRAKGPRVDHAEILYDERGLPK